MMDPGAIYTITAVGLFGVGLHTLMTRNSWLHRIMALNVMGSSIFLTLIALADRGAQGLDPVPQAMVITGIVVAVSATGLALHLLARLSEAETATKDSAGDS